MRRARARFRASRSATIDASILAASPAPTVYYRAEDCLGATWPALIGATLTRVAGTGAVAAVSQLGGRLAVVGSYSGSQSITPASGFSWVVVKYSASGASLRPYFAATVGGTVNTGQSGLENIGNVYAAAYDPAARFCFTSATQASVVGATYNTTSQIKLYKNSLTAVTNGGTPAALVASTVFCLGAQESTGAGYDSTNNIARVIAWPRELSATEIKKVVQLLASHYVVTLT